MVTPSDLRAGRGAEHLQLHSGTQGEFRANRATARIGDHASEKRANTPLTASGGGEPLANERGGEAGTPRRRVNNSH